MQDNQMPGIEELPIVTFQRLQFRPPRQGDLTNLASRKVRVEYQLAVYDGISKWIIRSHIMWEKEAKKRSESIMTVYLE